MVCIPGRMRRREMLPADACQEVLYDTLGHHGVGYFGETGDICA